MSEEVRKAAERLRDNGYSKYLLTAPGACNFYSSEKDTRTIADAYLAEHLADDEEPIDIAWIESVGFKVRHKTCKEWERKGVSGAMTVKLPNTWLFDGSIVPSPRTRGDVRRLCRALGIELKSVGEGRG